MRKAKKFWWIQDVAEFYGKPKSLGSQKTKLQEWPKGIEYPIKDGEVGSMNGLHQSVWSSKAKTIFMYRYVSDFKKKEVAAQFTYNFSLTKLFFI